MQDIIINIMNNYGYIGVFLLILIENVFPPIPSEVILLFGGFMTTYTNLSVLGMTLSSTLGSLIGAIILYKIGSIFNEKRLKKLINTKFGKILRINNKDIDSTFNYFQSKGEKTIFFCRFIPLIRSLISVPAGMNKMNMSKFMIYTTLGSLIWNIVLIVIGNIVGSKWEEILKILDAYSKYTVIILFIVTLIVIFKFYKKKSKE